MTASETRDARRIAATIHARLVKVSTLTAESMRAIRREFTKELAAASPEFMTDLALQLLEWPDFWHRVVGYELIHHHKPALRSLRARKLEQLGLGIGSWGDVDTFAGYLSGPAWREDQVSDTLIHRWARSKDRWWRRAALVSTVPLNHKAGGGNGDSARTLDICERLVTDRDDMVVKAMSWALRALAKRDAKAVRHFVKEHRDRLAPRVLREVNNKLTTGLKNPRR